MNRRGVAVLLLVAVWAASCANPPPETPQERTKRILESKQHRFDAFQFDPETPLADRILKCPAWLVKSLSEEDGKADYAAMDPSPAQKLLLAERIAELPEGMRAALKEKLIGIYFIKNLMGNGLTNWAVDGQRNVYSYMVFNPVGFGKSLSQTLTERDLTVFKDNPGLKIDAGDRYPGMVYTLLHEITHAYDYVKGITPFTEPIMMEIVRGKSVEGVSWDVWKSYQKPLDSAEFPLRSKIAFYGFSGGPHIAARDAAQVYKSLDRSPFASLYSTLSWGEDAAELHVFYHVTHILGQPYVITLPDGKGGTLRIEPMKSPRTLNRARAVVAKLQ